MRTSLELTSSPDPPKGLVKKEDLLALAAAPAAEAAAPAPEAQGGSGADGVARVSR